MGIEQNIIEIAKEHGYDLIEKNVARIAKAKERFFGIEEWKRCPCYPPSDTIHGCGTEACHAEIIKDGKCHCNLYKVKE